MPKNIILINHKLNISFIQIEYFILDPNRTLIIITINLVI
jgi:hypothetical protein